MTLPRVLAAVLSVLAISVLVPSAAGAAQKKTEIRFLQAIPINETGPLRESRRGPMGESQQWIIVGDLRTSSRCKANRRMKLFAIRNGNSRLVDRDRTSTNGGWAFRGLLDESRDDLRITVAPKKAGGDRCGADTERLGNDGPMDPTLGR